LGALDPTQTIGPGTRAGNRGHRHCGRRRSGITWQPWRTLRGVQRAIHRQLWPDKYAPDDKDDRRTKWQVEVWEPRVAATFGDVPIRFLIDLRNFLVHYAIPPVTLTTMWHGCGGQPMPWENIVALDRGELLKWSGWSGASRKYIETHDGDIAFIALLPAATTQSIATHPLSGLPGQTPW